MNLISTTYKLQNVATGRIFDDAGWTLDDPDSPTPSLIRAVYEHNQLTDRGPEYGLYRYAD